MERKLFVGLVASLVILAIAVIYVPAQSRSGGSKRQYRPRIVSRSQSFIVEGRVVAVKPDAVTIKTAGGKSFSFAIDDQTTVLGSDEDVSIATMADISLSAADLKISDHVEVVAERGQSRNLARILTRIATKTEHVAKRLN